MRDPDCTYGPLNVYTSDSLDKGQKYSKQQLDSLGSTTYVTSVPCPGGYCDTTIFVPFVPRNIKKYRVVEEWIFDHTYSDYRPYIIAIAPMHSPTAAGIQLNESALFWIKMDEFRPILVNQEIFNPYNDAARLSFDDWFEMRMFSSHIVKESNVFDLDVKYMPEFEDDGLAALLQAEKIKNDLFVFEHDLWEY
jgi:gliding motility associated protien GldN